MSTQPNKGRANEGREVEVKLDIPPDVAVAWRQAGPPSVGAQGAGTRQLVSAYFDTEAHDLYRAGLTLRVRRDGENRIQTVKADDGRGPFARLESETEIAGDLPEAAAIADKRLRRIVKRAGELRQLFETRIERTAWTHRYGGSLIEIVLDLGHVVAGDVSAPISEVELELKEGAVEDLFALARLLADGADLRLAIRSKSERGYALLAPEPPPGIKAAPIELAPDLAAAATFQAVAHASLRHFRLNEPRLLAERLPPSLHQCRVALRRLRAAISVCGKLIADDEIGRIKDELRALSRVLGEARNLDVYLARLDRHAEEHPLEAGLAELKTRARSEREAAYDRIVARLRTPEFRRLMLDLAAWIEFGPWLRDGKRSRLDEPVQDFAARLLDKRRRRLLERSAGLAELPAEEKHRVRIEAKKLRYAAEFFQSLYRKGKRARRHAKLIDALEEIQEALGDLNDIATGHEMASDLANRGQSAETAILASAAESIAVGQEAGADELTARAVAARKRLAKAKPFWS